MKRFWKSSAALFLIFALCACNTKNPDDTSDSVMTLPSDTSVSDTSDTTETTDTTATSETEDTSSDVKTSATGETKYPPVVIPSQSETKQEGYDVNDPDNVRGLSEKKVEYSFGYAKDGKPHSISIDNQSYFDSLSGVEALALDTKTEEKVLYLTFDCGYEYNNNTTRILDILEEKDVDAAFFCTLPYLQGNGAVAQRIIDDGHILGNHSNTHPVFPDITRTQMAEELYAVDEYLEETFDYDCRYFRFPTGAYSESSLELVTSVGHRAVFWSIAHADWDTENQPSYDVAFETVTSRLHPGAVILLHEVSNANVDILADFIDYARAEGYTFASLDDYEW